MRIHIYKFGIDSLHDFLRKRLQLLAGSSALLGGLDCGSQRVGRRDDLGMSTLGHVGDWYCRWQVVLGVDIVRISRTLI